MNYSSDKRLTQMHLGWARPFQKSGAEIIKTVAISDKKNEIIASLNAINDNTDCIIITGGLGPTKDDITKYTLAEYFGSKLKQDKPTLDKIESFQPTQSTNAGLKLQTGRVTNRLYNFRK